MKKGKFTEHQIVSAIKKQEAGIAVKDIARELGISEATFYNWKAKYGGMQASDVSKIGKPTLIDPLSPRQSSPLRPFQKNPLSPLQNDPLRMS